MKIILPESLRTVSTMVESKKDKKKIEVDIPSILLLEDPDTRSAKRWVSSRYPEGYQSRVEIVFIPDDEYIRYMKETGVSFSNESYINRKDYKKLLTMKANINNIKDMLD